MCVFAMEESCALPWLTLIAGAVVPESPGETEGSRRGKIKQALHVRSVYSQSCCQRAPVYLHRNYPAPPGNPAGQDRVGKGSL